MNFLKHVVLLSAISYSVNSFAFDQKEMMSELRNFVEKIVGSDLATKIFGPMDDIVLPAIPKVEKDAKKATVERKENQGKKLDPEKEKALNYSFVMELFDVTRKSKPSKDDVSNWMNVLGQGATREGVYRALVLDQTYYGLENFRKPVSDKLAEFAARYMPTYLGQGSEMAKLKEANFFTLKRILTERSLEIFDELMSKNVEDGYNWYAVFSADLANSIPKAWENEIRKSNNKKAHKQWAMKVPEQQVKSEIIIKLHKTFNYLQE